jgi:hypothetical protein
MRLKFSMININTRLDQNDWISNCWNQRRSGNGEVDRKQLVSKM